MGQCCFHCCYEFQLKKFGFGDVHPARFAMFQWRLPPILYLLYRIAIAVYADTWLIYTSVDYGNAPKLNQTTEPNSTFIVYDWPVYLTNWTYTLLCLYLTLHAITALVCLCVKPVKLCRRVPSDRHRALFKELQVYPSLWGDSYEPLPGNEDPESMELGQVLIKTNTLPWYFKVIWILFNAISCGAVMVTVVFFIFLWPQFGTDSIDIDNLQLHGINSVIILLEHSVTAIPVQLLHFIYPFIYGLCYIFFSAIFYGAGNKDPIYPKVLDWRQGHIGSTLLMVVLVGFVFLPLLQILFFILYKIKICIFNKVSNSA